MIRITSALAKHMHVLPKMLCLLCLTTTVYAPSFAWAQAQSLSRHENSGTPLIDAIYKRDLPEVKRLIESGADLDRKNAGGSTALLESIALNPPGVAAQLIVAGANPNLAGDRKSTTPLMQAAWYCQSEIVRLLLQRGAAIDARDADGDTALMHAASNCGDTDGEIVGILLSSGAFVNARSKSGDTALTVAAFYGDEAAVRKLVVAGADLNAKNDEGETALTIARDRVIGRKKSHDRIYAFLRTATKRTARRPAVSPTTHGRAEALAPLDKGEGVIK